MAFALVCCVMCAYCPPAQCLARQSTKSDATGCDYSNQMHESDKALLLLRQAPTRFRLMSSRYVEMVQAARGYHCTGTVSVGFDGYHFFQTGSGDDPGIAELISTLSRLTGLPLGSTYDLTITFVVAAGLFIGYAGLWKLYPERQLRWMGVGVFLCLGIAEAREADQYVFQISPLIAGVPWLIYFAMHRRLYALTTSAVLLAFSCSWCALVRAGTIPVCLTFLISMFFLRKHIQRPLIPWLLVISSLVPSIFFEKSMIARRDAALATVGAVALGPASHSLWPTVYIGLGFIPNSEVSEYRDGVAADKIRSIDPTAAYESARAGVILRHEVWRILKTKPTLVMGVVAAKVSIIVLLGAILLYPARRLIFTESALVWLDVAFLLTMGMSAMNAIVAVPRATYLLTFLCLGFLYSAIKLLRSRGPINRANAVNNRSSVVKRT